MELQTYYKEIVNNKIVIGVKPPAYHYVVGIDPGTTNLGVSLFKICNKTNNILSISTFNIRVKGKVELGDRINFMGDSLGLIFKKYKPVVVAVETPFVSIRRIQAAIPLARMFQQIVSVVRSSSKDSGVAFTTLEVTPTEAKKTAGGTGRCDKDCMRKLLEQHTVLKDLLLDDINDMSEHEVDAVFIALVAVNKLNK